jgi:hypothetical protein
LACDDIRRAFDNIPIKPLVTLHESFLNNRVLAETANGSHFEVNFAENRQRLLQLIRVVLEGDVPGRLVAIDQGSPYSPTALNAYLHHYFDLGTGPQGFIAPQKYRFRYADNIVAACKDMDEGEEFLADTRRRLRAAGLSLKGENGGRPVDLKRGGNVHLLGFVLYRKGRHLNFKLHPDSWVELREKLLEAHETPHPARMAKAIILGWPASRGPAFAGPVDRTVAEIIRIAASAAFREIPGPAELEAACRKARKRWQSIKSVNAGKWKPVI